MQNPKLIHFGSGQTLIQYGTLKGFPTLCLKYLDHKVPASELDKYNHSHIKPEAFLSFSTKEGASDVCDALFKLLQVYDELKTKAPLSNEDWVETIKDGVL